MTTNTTPLPPPPVSTFVGVNYDVGQLSQKEAAFIDFARKAKERSGLDLCALDAITLRMITRFQSWRKQGKSWLGLVLCDEGIIRFWDGEPSGKITP